MCESFRAGKLKCLLPHAQPAATATTGRAAAAAPSAGPQAYLRSETVSSDSAFNLASLRYCIIRLPLGAQLHLAHEAKRSA